MGSEKGHKRKANHNEKFLQLLSANDPGPNFCFPDWWLTVAFYIAVQYVDAKLAKLLPPKHPQTHYDRNSYVSIYLPKAEATFYLFIKSKSEYARYIPDSEKKISVAMVNRCVKIATTQFL